MHNANNPNRRRDPDDLDPDMLSIDIRLPNGRIISVTWHINDDLEAVASSTAASATVGSYEASTILSARRHFTRQLRNKQTENDRTLAEALQLSYERNIARLTNEDHGPSEHHQPLRPATPTPPNQLPLFAKSEPQVTASAQPSTPPLGPATKISISAIVIHHLATRRSTLYTHRRHRAP